MSTNGETAELVVKEGIQITESAVKLAGLGAKNLAALLIAIAKDNPKLSGKTGLKRLIQDGEELTIFSVKQEDLKGFQMESKRYGVLFYPVINKVEKTGTVEIMAKAKDAKQINRIFERMGYPAPVREDAAKKASARAPSENSSKERGNGAGDGFSVSCHSGQPHECRQQAHQRQQLGNGFLHNVLSPNAKGRQFTLSAFCWVFDFIRTAPPRCTRPMLRYSARCS